MRRGAAARAVALLAAALAALAAQPAAAAAKPMTQKACEALCKASVAACAAAEAAGARDAAVVAAAARGFGCKGAARAPVCKDLAMLVLDALAYEGSVHNGLRDGTRTACESYAEVCVPWCANARAPAPVPVGPTPPPSALPLGGNTTTLLNRFALTTRDPAKGQFGGVAVEVTYDERAGGERARAHFHKSIAVTCVLDGCARLTVSGGRPREYCAEAGGPPTCYMMPAYRILTNENTRDKTLKLIDFFALTPDEERFYPLE